MTNLPSIEFTNLDNVDPIGQALWSYWLGEARHQEFRAYFERFGRLAAEATPHSALADQYPPILHTHNKVGERIDRVEYHPSYLELQKISYGEGLLALKYDSHFLKKNTDCRHTLGFALGYYFAQTETGLFCPLCMTDALGRVLETHNAHPMAKLALKHITSSDLNELWQGAMFLTEKQGGSDVGANTCIAEEISGKWFLSGDKWFCSNADAKAILALARMPGLEGSAEKGTRGLGLFLVLRDQPNNNARSWLTHRLKNKLGVRSMASGEITFQKTEAFLIGGAGEGFKIMTEMVNMSRIYNSVASLAIIRRSIMEAYAFGKERTAFGSSLTKLPLWRACMADLNAEHLGQMFLVFEAIKHLDQADSGNAESAHLVRVLTPLAKALSGKLSVFAASEAMELIGGNAYIEDHIMPRLLRDAQVLPIWEGTTNIQSIDVLRVFLKEGVEKLFVLCEQAIKNASAVASVDLIKGVSERVQSLSALVADIKTYTPEDMQRVSRELLEKSGRAVILCLVLEGMKDPKLKPVCDAALRRLLLRRYSTAPLGGNVAADLQSTEDILLSSIL
ncbi:MAG: acyl-CoA dehydrogenase family protein [Bdellovibrionaceae bacterium]|nr:acyl-CoA dehydrogenase family protein [Pseudobdellovibrionaceae bacterium]